MPQPHIEPNPFALMMNPEAVIAAMERSERLAHLQSRICRPLDRIVATKPEAEADAEADAVDIEGSGEETEA